MKFRALPLVLLPESVHRLRLNFEPEVALTVSEPELLMKSKPVPALPVASSSCQL